MSVRTVVAKDFLDVRRARTVRFVGGLYTTLIVLLFAQVRFGTGGPSDARMAVWNMVVVGAAFIPAIALVSAYLAIAGERESGSIVSLLSTPVSRRDVVLGKYVSRAVVVAASLAVAFTIAAGLAAVWFPAFDPAVFAGTAALTTLYALAYVSVAIAVSASTATRARAMAGAIGFYFATNLVTLFDDVSGLAALEYVANELLGLGLGADAIQFLGILSNPTRAYLASTMLVLPAELTEAIGLPARESLSWYVQPEIAVAILFGWLVVPVAIGWYRFERADIT
ncbi:ABC-2 type transport system permease protein [Halobiforma haloterrestris]|uniref:ABC-2 type transport system permease protein n=1 Tax=Natronobacterium haloterrestre TaxID=148448 RepID=A0A1I1HT20_NATHA|nr:ABC transporter permease subunit [Halobiforma haloterrestris]SFC27227.1 ABC-2 type transport system permease protein [Halobiforma haloterrestris]